LIKCRRGRDGEDGVVRKSRRGRRRRDEEVFVVAADVEGEGERDRLDLLGIANAALELKKRLNGLLLVRVLFLLLSIVRVGGGVSRANEDRGRGDSLLVRGEGLLDATELIKELFRGGENESEGKV
jgi:hypothetical protein